ncbi:hypothetical protein MTR_1g050372 [Medicago truncatula]|uniref:Uncharacterized protein n=1 Tax=Medicago truncatula TaxID=3880 RepID=A0A072VII0_MEDTR|nr:hypothetical protein MTR_1g050372 [Medicago truncatula]
MAPASTSAEQNVTNDENEGSIDSEEFEAYEAAHETESESSDEDDFEGSYSRDMDQIDHQGYADLGDPLMECQRCGACMWYQERKQKSRHSANPKFGLCCGDGKIQLPYME